jgi:hypothetical protein
MHADVGSILFEHPGTTSTRCLLGPKPFDIQPADYDETLYHVKGVTGSYRSIGGRLGRNLVLRVRYISSTAELAQTAYETDLAALEGQVFTVNVDITAYSRCMLRSGAIIAGPIGCISNNANAAYMDVEFKFYSAE